MASANLFKRCGCRNPDTGRPYHSRCPRLRRPNGAWDPHHGSWCYQIELPAAPGGKRRQLKRGGFTSAAAAQAELDHARRLLALAAGDPDQRRQVGDLLAGIKARQPLPGEDDMRRRLHHGLAVADDPTVAEYLTEWLNFLAVSDSVTGATVRGYESIVRVHLIPHLGHIRLSKLRVSHVRAMLAAIMDRNKQIEAARASHDPSVRRQYAGVRPTGPATRHRIRAALRAALNTALADGHVTMNAAAHVPTPEERKKPILWTDERVQRWRETGEVPGPVMVWTAPQARAFLDFAAQQVPDLHPMLHFVAYRGPRRGEACGLKESEVAITRRTAAITNQITLGRHGYVHKPPKSATSSRAVHYDDDTAAVLARYQATKAAQKLAAGPAWPDTGLFFVRPDGRPWNPQSVSQRFRRVTARAGLPPIRFHDLRHVAATISLQGGVDIKVVQELLGHTTSTLTRDTYTSVVEDLHRDAANAVARLMRHSA
jgi:integrase